MSDTTRWADAYLDLAHQVTQRAPDSGPFLLGFNVCVDAVWTVDHEVLARLDTLAGSTDETSPGADLCRQMLERICEGRGGEIFHDWPEGPAWFAERLPTPHRFQVGGTGAQAGWTLAALGARCVLPLVDRSKQQLDVLHPDLEIATDRWTRVREVSGTGDVERARPAHHIFEFTAGSLLRETTLPRSTRIIVRFTDDGIECDDQFTAQQQRLLPAATAAVVSGMNAIGDSDQDSWQWLAGVVDTWAGHGVPNVHLELADYARARGLEAAAAFGAGRAHTLGMSLSELRKLLRVSAPSWTALPQLATRYGYDAVVVHADQWALAAHREQPSAIERRLAVGNLLASARARSGAPTARLELPATALLTDDHPSSQQLQDGWTLSCVPAPWLPRPTSTIGLGDSFVAGLQLGAALSPSEVAR